MANSVSKGFVDPAIKRLIKKILLIPDDKSEFQDSSPLLWLRVNQVYPNPRRRKADLEYINRLLSMVETILKGSLNLC